MFERPQGGERAVLVHVYFPPQFVAADVEEFEELVKAADAEPVELIIASRDKPQPKFFIGEGKVEEVKQAVLAHTADVVIFNHELSPAQERNLEKALKCRVLDRTGLILDIFAQRARTHEGKLQVELAQLQHLSTRLVRGWTHLERQKGGIGLRGPGETQLESDRRMLRVRIKQLTRHLEKVRKQRELSRQARQKAEIPSVSLVGYTNAGKSTLFNRLTESDVLVADQLFATLDPTMRRIKLPKLGAMVLADTVGFVRRLPHDLVAAFRATLEEARSAHLLLHVVDASDPHRRETMQEVNDVLAQIDADKLPQLIVYNKLDRLDGEKPRIDRDEFGKPWRVWLSAAKGDGIELLNQALTELLAGQMVEQEISLAPSESAIRAKLYEIGAVLSEAHDEAGNCLLRVQLAEQQLHNILSRSV